MKFTKATFFFIILVFNYIKAEPEAEEKKKPEKGVDYPDISCGKANPTKETHCTKYGTDSGMVCCWVKKTDESDAICTLISDKSARSHGIEGNKNYGDEYWSCGNKSFYIYLNMFLFFISILLLN